MKERVHLEENNISIGLKKIEWRSMDWVHLLQDAW
jgi:hypothetical protein